MVHNQIRFSWVGGISDMAINARAVAMGMLMGCGFAGGFLLSGMESEDSSLPRFRKADTRGAAQNAARALMSNAAASAKSSKDDGSADDILNEVAAADGSGSGKGDGAGALGTGIPAAKTGAAGGKDGAAAGANKNGILADKKQDASKAKAGDDPGGLNLAAKSGQSTGKPGSGAAAAPGGPCVMADLVGAEAAEVLLGNTVDQEGSWGAHDFVYYSPRHLVGQIHPSSISLSPWDPKNGVLCDGTACGPIHVRHCVDERLSTTRAGELQLAHGRWAPILRGNIKNFPSYIPFVDAPRPLAKTRAGEKPAGGASAQGSDGTPFDTDRVYLAQRPNSGDDSRVTFYNRDGRTMDYDVPAAQAVQEGMTINVGWWTLQKGLLCQGRADDASHPSCYRPKKKEAGHVTLTAQDGQIDLIPLADPIVSKPRVDD